MQLLMRDDFTPVDASKSKVERQAIYVIQKNRKKYQFWGEKSGFLA